MFPTSTVSSKKLISSKIYKQTVHYPLQTVHGPLNDPNYNQLSPHNNHQRGPVRNSNSPIFVLLKNKLSKKCLSERQTVSIRISKRRLEIVRSPISFSGRRSELFLSTSLHWPFLLPFALRPSPCDRRAAEVSG